MKKILKTLLLFSFLFLLNSAIAQEFKFSKEIAIAANQIEVDNFDNIYIVETYKISKLDSKGQLLYTYETFKQGEISYFDISDPLKPIVYFQNFNVLSILDNKLSVINTTNLLDKNINLIEAICSSSNITYWLFDKFENRLKEVDKNFNFLNQSETFFTLFDSINIVQLLKVKNNQLYLLDNLGIKIFDMFGGFVKKHSIENIQSIQIIGNEIIYFDGEYLYSLNEKTQFVNRLNYSAIDLETLEAKITKNFILIRKANKCVLHHN